MEYRIISDEFNSTDHGKEQQDFYKSIAERYDDVYVPLLTSNPDGQSNF